MAAVMGNGALARDARGVRSYMVEVVATTPLHDDGCILGFAATPPSAVKSDDARSLWASALMWRVIGESLAFNIKARPPHSCTYRLLVCPVHNV